MNLENAGDGLTHEDFKDRLRKSEPARRLVAQLLIALNACELRIAPLEVAPTYGERGAYIDDGDIHARFKPEGKWYRFEVKGLSVDFTGLDDWPFGKRIFVDEKDGWDRKDPKPAGYFSVNRAKTVAIYLPCSNPAAWSVEKIPDSHYKAETEFLVATTSGCKAYTLPRWSGGDMEAGP